MGYVMVYSPCFGCQRVFGYNPHRVPSINIDGEKQPVCRECIERTNPIREANGLAPTIPHPEAYEPVPEENL